MAEALVTRTLLSLGIPKDMFMGVYCITCGYYWIPLYNLIPISPPYRNMRHIFSIVASCLLYLSLFELKDFLELAAMCGITYLLTYILRHNKYMPLLVFVYVMSHYCFRLFQLQIVELVHEKHIDAATPMMVMVLRLTTFAWNVHDGMQDEKNVIPELKPNIIKEFPNVLEFFGFTMFFATFITGPALNLNDYRYFIRRAGPFAAIPSRVTPTLKAAGLGLAFAGIYAFVMDKFSYEHTTTPAFLERFTFWQRVAYMQAAGAATRTKYYAVFKLAEGACNMVGIGYTGVDPSGNHVWNRAQGVIITGVEFGENFRQLFSSWNMKTALWLRHCVYLRMVRPGQKPGAFVTWATFMVSALWHGFHPGYYLTFGMGAAFPVLARSARQWLRPLFLKPSKLHAFKWCYDFLGWLFTWTSLNCIVAPFIVWHLRESIASWSSVGYYSMVMLSVGFLVLDVCGGGRWIRRNLGAVVGAERHAKNAKKVD